MAQNNQKNVFCGILRHDEVQCGLSYAVWEGCTKIKRLFTYDVCEPVFNFCGGLFTWELCEPPEFNFLRVPQKVMCTPHHVHPKGYWTLKFFSNKSENLKRSYDFIHQKIQSVCWISPKWISTQKFRVIFFMAKKLVRPFVFQSVANSVLWWNHVFEKKYRYLGHQKTL